MLFEKSHSGECIIPQSGPLKHPKSEMKSPQKLILKRWRSSAQDLRKRDPKSMASSWNRIFICFRFSTFCVQCSMSRQARGFSRTKREFGRFWLTWLGSRGEWKQRCPWRLSFAATVLRVITSWFTRQASTWELYTKEALSWS